MTILIKKENVEKFKKIFKFLRNTSEISIFFQKKGILITQSDDAKVLGFMIKFDLDFFDEYEIPETLKHPYKYGDEIFETIPITLNSTDFVKILDTINNKNPLEIIDNDNMISILSGKKKRHVKKIGSDIYYWNLNDFPVFNDLDLIGSHYLDDFMDEIIDIEKLTKDIIKFEYIHDESKLILTAEGYTAGLDSEFEVENNNKSTDFNVKCQYGSGFLIHLKQIYKMFEDVRIMLSSNMPLQLRFKTEGLKMLVVVGPRVDQDDEDYYE